jgi:hypothetical protein
MGTDRRPILATNHLLHICQCHYVGDLRRNSTPTNTNSKHDFGGCFYLSWWTWRPPQMMRRASPDAACSGLHSKPLDAASGRVLALYHPGGCHGHRCCCAVPMATKHNFKLARTHTKQWTDQLGFFVNQRIIKTRTISMTNVPYFMWRPNDVKIL